MKIISVTPFSSIARDIRNLYFASFPKEERLPYWFLLLKQAEFLAYLDQEKLVGFSYTVKGQSCDFLLFLAVAESHQSHGYGTAILQKVKEKAGGKPLIVTIEPPFEVSENAEQRLRRLAFYEKNGFKLTDHFYQENTETYQIMTTKQPFDKKGFSKDVSQFFLGIVKTKVN
ncbi:GNAT family N-acetyltransferase [Streptococcus sp. S784/96/1]|uniref:GNAT family N-acetyltransferase n=1 Tax=Streptococcus sp. S784/96/1 TaxID=2653499 RepID=UPI00138A065D|nr:GNAT family N-acetyltransferase [Streptococcus sp. S784/96/1]